MNNTKERPIVLTAQEVNAVLAGDKTQHRVPVDADHSVSLTYHSLEAGGASPERIDDLPFECPLGNVGDRLWVQEPTLAIENVGWIGPVFVASDDGRNAMDWGYGPYDDPAHIPACELTYNKSCDLSYEDSRILLEIVDIRIERLKDITAANAQAEGSPLQISMTKRYPSFTKACGEVVEWFKGYWNLKHSKLDSWESNPWVWVVEFKVFEPSEVSSAN